MTKKFKFRLESLYRLRQEEERQALFELKSVQQKEISILEKLKFIDQDRRRWMENYNEVGSRQNASQDLLLIENYLISLEGQQKYQDSELRKVRAEIESAMEIVRQAYRARRQIEHLREKQKQKHEENIIYLEKRHLDEMSTLHFIHKKMSALLVLMVILFSSAIYAQETTETKKVEAAEAKPAAVVEEKPKQSLSEYIRSDDRRIQYVTREKELYMNLTREMERVEREKGKIDSLKSLQAELDRRQKELEKLSEELSRKVEKKTEENDNLKLLISLYESLQASQAADLMKRLPVRVSVTMIKMMLPKKSSKILSAMDPKFAAMISRELIKLPQNNNANQLVPNQLEKGALAKNSVVPAAKIEKPEEEKSSLKPDAAKPLAGVSAVEKEKQP